MQQYTFSAAFSYVLNLTCSYLQDVLYRVNTALAGLVWNQELFPFDILLLALADRDDDPLALRIVVVIANIFSLIVIQT